MRWSASIFLWSVFSSKWGFFCEFLVVKRHEHCQAYSRSGASVVLAEAISANENYGYLLLLFVKFLILELMFFYFLSPFVLQKPERTSVHLKHSPVLSSCPLVCVILHATTCVPASCVLGVTTCQQIFWCLYYECSLILGQASIFEWVLT